MTAESATYQAIRARPSTEGLFEKWYDNSDVVAALCRTLNDRLLADEVLFAGKPLPTSIRPHFLARSIHDSWARVSERLLVIMEKIGRLVVSELDLYRTLGLPAEARALIAIDPGCERLAVVCRPDMVNQGAALSLLELNCDSPAMMMFADCVQGVLAGAAPLRDLVESGAVRLDARTPALLEAVTSGMARPSFVAIVDWSDESTCFELKRTAAEFRRLGVDTVVADPRELRLVDRRLCLGHRPIDLVYRRVLAKDFLVRADELWPLLAAYREGFVRMVNPLRSWVIGTKATLALLHRKDVQAHLEPDERQLIDRIVPETHLVHSGLHSRLIAERREWVLKPCGGLGGADVVIGNECDDARWSSAVRAAKDELWIAQRFVAPPTYDVIDFNGARTQRHMVWSPFVFGGKYAGGIARTSAETVINIKRDGALLPTVELC